MGTGHRLPARGRRAALATDSPVALEGPSSPQPSEAPTQVVRESRVLSACSPDAPPLWTRLLCRTPPASRVPAGASSSPRASSGPLPSPLRSPHPPRGLVRPLSAWPPPCLGTQTPRGSPSMAASGGFRPPHHAQCLPHPRSCGLVVTGGSFQESEPHSHVWEEERFPFHSLARQSISQLFDSREHGN